MNDNTQIEPAIKMYEGNGVSFLTGESVMVNATQMAKPFNKVPKDWLRTSPSKEFIDSLSAVRHICPTDLVKIQQGGDPKMQGTWMHEDVALEFARWLSPKFAIWCNDRIKELLTTGTTQLTPWEQVTDALTVAQNQLALEKDLLNQARDTARYNLELYHTQKKETEKLLPDANYTRTILNSQSTWNTNVIAKEMGMSAVTLNKHLKKLNIQYKQHGVWLLTESYQGKGYTKSKTYSYLNAKGEVCSRVQMEWTEKGRRWLLNMHENGKF